jgi:predicted amidohydrolase
MRTALIPLRTRPGDVQSNFDRFCQQVERLAPLHPDLVCLPECTFTGYLSEEAQIARFAEAVPGPTVDRVSVIARQYGVYLCFGMLEVSSHGFYNTAVLLDRNGEVALVHRKNVEKPPFLKGHEVHGVHCEFGAVSVLICGDLFSKRVVQQLNPRLSLLLVPMARCFDKASPDPDRWSCRERRVYLQAVRRAGVPAVIVNSLEVDVDLPCFGGAMVVGADGRLLAESPHGSDAPLCYDWSTGQVWLLSGEKQTLVNDHA